MPLRMFVRAQRLLLMVLLVVAAIPAAAQEDLNLQVAWPGEAGEIGQDLVLYLAIDTVGTPPSISDLKIEVTTPGNDGLLGAAYPAREAAAGAVPEALAAGNPTLVVEWAAPIPAGTSSGDYDLRVAVSTANGTAEWSGILPVAFGGEWSADRITDFIERKGMGLFLLVVFGFGILMSLSPCIYPMIPITLAVIGSQAQEKGALHGLVMSVTYVLGMAFVYAVMGALSATVFSGINAFMQSPVVLIPIALLLLVLSFSMFGAFELEAPRFLRDRLQGGSGGNRGGVIGVFAMGMIAGLVASPCVGPFLAALLVWVATTGNWVLGFFSLFTFGIGMGLLLIGVGTFPALLGTMPRSGGWMETVRRGMGLLLIAMAFFFVRPGMVLPQDVFLLLVGMTTILVAVFMGAFDALAPEAGWWPRTSKGLGLAFFLVGSLLLVSTVWMMLAPSLQTDSSGHVFTDATPAATRNNTVPDAGTVASPTTSADILPQKVQWTKIHTGENVKGFLAEQRAAAKAAGKPVIIDFWAHWCKLCLVLDKKVWTDPAIVRESQRFVRLKVDATKSDEEMDAIFDEYQVPGLPTIVFIDSRGEVLLGRNSNFKPADQMLESMQGIR